MNFDKLKELADALPDNVKANAQALIERMDSTIEGIGDEGVKWKVPFARLIQATTDRSKLAKGVTIGDILIGENKQETPMKFIPIRAWEARQMWSPDKDEAKMLCSSPDAKVGYLGYNCKECPHSKFVEGKGSECGKLKVVMAIKADLSEIFTTQFGKTGYKVGMEFETVMKKAGVAPYRRVYGMSGETNKQYKNVENFKIETFEGKERDTPAELLPFITELFTIIGADRKENVDAFHKFIAAKKQTPEYLALQASNAAEESVVLIEDAQVKTEVKTSPMAKKYEV